jgi:TetR/AcrR family transcriptional regulator, cholesterol catabolism regulator
VKGFQAFKDSADLSSKQICVDFLGTNRERIRIKKDETAVRNLVKIFDATLTISTNKGFQATSMRELSRETGLSMGALYSYFKSKEELLEMIRNLGCRILERVLSEEVKHGIDPREKLSLAIETHLYISEMMKSWFYFSYMEVKNLRREEQKRMIEMELYTERLFVEIIKSGIEAGIFREVDPTMTSAVLKAMLQDWYLKKWKYQRRKLSVEDYALFIIGMMEYFLQKKKGE